MESSRFALVIVGLLTTVTMCSESVALDITQNTRCSADSPVGTYRFCVNMMRSLILSDVSKSKNSPISSTYLPKYVVFGDLLPFDFAEQI